MAHVIPAHRSRPSDDPIFALNKEATARRANGDSIVNATVGAMLDDEGRLAVMPTPARVVREVPTDEWAPYAPIAGTQQFLDAVIGDLFSTEPEMKACAVAAATPGGTGALRSAIGNYLEPRQSVLTTSYFWGPYQTLADEGDRRLTTFSMFNAQGEIDTASLDSALAKTLAAEKRALLLLNDPCHNPTGYSMRADEWRKVCAVIAARSKDGPISLLVDTAYFAYHAHDPRAFLRELRPLLGKVALAFAWSASKTFTHYGLRVGAIVACVPDEKERAETGAAFSYTCRGTWSNCSRGGLSAITRLLTEPELARACDAERDGLKKILHARVSAFNALAPSRGLKYPRYEGGFFVTVFADDAHERAARMKDAGVFVVPQKGALRVALCSVAERDVPRLVDALAARP